MRPRAAILVFAGVTAVLGCDRVPPAVCDRSAEGNPWIRYTQGTVVNDVYMSSSWDDMSPSLDRELLYFPGGMHYELEHMLRAPPRWITSYLSFSREGTKDGGALAQAAGNQVVVLGVDDMVIRVANDTCSDYWLLVTAGGAGDAGASP